MGIIQIRKIIAIGRDREKLEGHMDQVRTEQMDRKGDFHQRLC